MKIPSFTTLVLTYPQPAILQVTLHRPEVLHAINVQMMQELYTLWSEVATAADIRCVILTGGGEKAFCAGADLKERYRIDIETWKAQHAVLQKAMRAMVECPVPIIAAVNGVAFGGGLELALASDFIYAAETALFAQSETKLGIMPGAMGTQNLPQACGIRRAKELCYTAAAFSAEQAYSWGIVNSVCPRETLQESVLGVAAQIAKNAPLAIREAKKSLAVSLYLDLNSGYSNEIEAYNRLLETRDRKEGIAAFNEKRVPDFQNK